MHSPVLFAPGRLRGACACALLWLMTCLNLQAATTTTPTTASAYEQGLLQEIYSLPRRPRRVRDVLPGLTAKVVRVVPTANIASDEDLAGLTGNVQAQYSGEILIPKAGEYRFEASSDDGMDLTIDEKIVLANAWINGRNEPTRATISLSEGWHPMRIRFYQGDGGFGLTLHWRPAGATSADIPAASFRVSTAQIASGKSKLHVANENDPAHAHRSVFRTQGFFELPESDGDLLVELLEGPTLFSETARKDFAETIKQTHYNELPYWHQVKVLSGFLRGWYANDTRRGTVHVRADYTLDDPVAVRYDGWHGAKRQGFKHTVTIDGKTFTIFTPAADSPERDNVARAIAGLPEALRVLLRTVRVEPYGTASEFNGGGNEIWVRLKRPAKLDELDNTFSHEIGHILMNTNDCYTAWEKAIIADTLSVSHYGRLNPSEDFAEFVRLTLSSEGEAAQVASLRRLFPGRMKVLDEVFGKVRFQWIKK